MKELWEEVGMRRRSTDLGRSSSEPTGREGTEEVFHSKMTITFRDSDQ